MEETTSPLALQIQRAVHALLKCEGPSQAKMVQGKGEGEEVREATKGKDKGKGKRKGESEERTSKKSLILEGFEDKANFIWLLVGLNQMKERVSKKPHRLVIPKPWRLANDETHSVCLITKDPQRQYKDLVKTLKLSAITRVIGISKLRAKFKPFEAKRQLCSSYDFFLADECLLPILPALLGKTFFKRKRLPAPVKLTDPNEEEKVAAELTSAIQATYLNLGEGSCTSIRVGLSTQTAEDICANLQAILKQLANKLPGGLANIRSLHIKTASSIPLPIYIRRAQQTSPLAKEESEQDDDLDENGL